MCLVSSDSRLESSLHHSSGLCSYRSEPREEGEQLHFLMEPVVQELKAHKRRGDEMFRSSGAKNRLQRTLE